MHFALSARPTVVPATHDTRADHASYIAGWLELLRHDAKAIFTAAAKASQAVAYLKSLQGKE